MISNILVPLLLLAIMELDILISNLKNKGVQSVVEPVR